MAPEFRRDPTHRPGFEMNIGRIALGVLPRPHYPHETTSTCLCWPAFRAAAAPVARTAARRRLNGLAVSKKPGATSSRRPAPLCYLHTFTQDNSRSIGRDSGFRATTCRFAAPDERGAPRAAVILPLTGLVR